jgi:predicted  nucleic acid-binding Zn-ribbon protein
MEAEMSDEELVKRLRDPSTSSEASTARHQAADRIESLTEQLEQLVAINEAARADAKEAEAYAEELAGDQVDLCRQLIAAEDKLAECEARLGKAVEALNYCIKAPFSGWTIAQGYARATLAEIESSTPYGLGEKG